MKSVSVFGALATLMVLFLSGCGGGGGGGSSNTTPPATATPTISVDWPARSRNVSGPSSALSVAFTLAPLSVSGSNITWEGDRSSALTAHTDAFAAGSSGTVGEWQLTGTFYAGAAETGAVVGTVSTPVDLAANGTLTTITGAPLSVVFTPVVKSAVVAASQTLPFFQTTTLTATALDANNNAVAVSPGSFIWTQNSGSSSFSLTAAGVGTPIASGSGTVSVAIDGVTSPAVTVIVAPSTIVYNYEALGFAYDSTRNCYYVAAYNYPSTGAAAILKVDLATGNVITSLPISTVQSHLVVSNDGTTLYSLADTGTVTQISLASFAVENVATLPSGLSPVTALPLPGASNSWVVSTRDASADDEGTYVYDQLTPRSGHAQLGLSIAVDSTGANIYGYQALSNISGTRNYSIGTIDANGTSLTTSLACPFQGPGTLIHYFDGEIVADDGSVLAPSTGTLLTTLTVPAGSAAAGTAAGTRVYFTTVSPNQVLSFNASTFAQATTYTMPNTVSGNLASTTLMSAGIIAFHNSGGSSNQFYLVGGLP